MPNELFFIHPLGQAVAFLVGVFNLISAWKRWCFSLTAHLNVGVMFYALILIGSGVGLVLARLGLRNNINLDSPLHNMAAAVLVAAIVCGAITGFILLNKKKSNNSLLVVHRYCNFAVLCMVIVQFIIGIGPLAAVM